MKREFPHIGLARLCGWFGITRQAHYQYSWFCYSSDIEQKLVIEEVKRIRLLHRRMGTRKLYEVLQSFMIDNQIKMGRDALFDLLAVHGLLVRKKRRTTITTNSKHWFRRYPNLARGFTPCGINQLWVSDITYWKAKQQFFYISFITDAYSRKIVGYYVAENMESVHCIQALKIALCGLGPQGHFKLTHHSDRGLQYCSNNYVQLLNENNITISMTENGDPLENALAERINGIIKDEYLQFCKPANIIEAKAILKRTVKLYNQQRPHMSIGNLTPEQIHCNINLKTEKLWKNYYHSKPKFEHPKNYSK